MRQEYLSDLGWNFVMISMIFLAAMLKGRDIEKQVKLPKNAIFVKPRSFLRKILYLRGINNKSKFALLPVTLQLYGYIQAIVFSCLNILVYMLVPDKLYSLGTVISTVQIGILLVIILVGIMIVQIRRGREK